ncbi:MAG: helicase-associated domain-containing protein [Candidatus Latescibacter sp.]|nr:helicase-associated domain-containing protein [Candidatus Latescibacter sp.]
MYLRDYLHDIPLKALKSIACSLGITVEYEARIKLMNAIDRAFWDGALGIRLLNSLTEEERRVLSLIAFSYDAGVHESALAKKLEKISGTRRRELEEILKKLVSYALIGGIRDKDPLFFCLRGNSETIRKTIIGGFLAPPEPAVPVPPSSIPTLMEDIIAFLAEAYREELPLTLKGRLKRTCLERIFTGSTTGGDAPQFFSPDNRDALAIDYLRERGLLVFDYRYARASSLLGGWLEMTVTERTQDAASFTLTRILSDSSTIVPFVGILGEIPAGTEIDPSDFASMLHTGTMAAGGYARLQGKITQMLSVFASLGLLIFRNGKFILTFAGERFSRGDVLPFERNESDLFTLQPNFEVIAGPELNLRVRFILELLSSRKNRDVIITHSVNRGGVARARERGMSTGEVVEFFRRHSRTPLPQNVQFSLETWAKAYGSIYFEPVMLMRFQDPETCRNVLHIPEIAPYIKERLSETALVVSSERISILTAILKRTGYLPEVYGESVADTARSGEPYAPQSISTILARYTMPEIHRNFFFPEDAPPSEKGIEEVHSKEKQSGRSGSW